MALAEQFERGSELGRAIACYQRAARQALAVNDLAAVTTRVSKGIACGAEGAELGALLVLQMEAQRWRGEFEDVVVCGKRAIFALPPGSALWYDAVAEVISSMVRIGRTDGLDELVSELADESLGVEAGSARHVAWARALPPLLIGGGNHKSLAAKLLERLDSAELDLADPTVAARIHQARATHALSLGDPSIYVEEAEAAARGFEAAGDLRNACLQRCNAGHGQTQLGDYAAAESTLRAALAAAERMETEPLAALARENLGIALAHRGGLHEARAVEERAIEGAARGGFVLLAAGTRVNLAEILGMGRNHVGAERAARDALGILGERIDEMRAQALGRLSHALLAQRRVHEALAASTEAMEIVDQVGWIPDGEAAVRLAHAEALFAAGKLDDAREAVLVARDRLWARAEKISDGKARDKFLENVPENARTLKLATDWEIAQSQRSRASVGR
jgi:tetratricopeptide (TPR) repeat protein